MSKYTSNSYQKQIFLIIDEIIEKQFSNSITNSTSKLFQFTFIFLNGVHQLCPVS